jgi:hypothetical protein
LIHISGPNIKKGTLCSRATLMLEVPHPPQNAPALDILNHPLEEGKA